MHNTRTVKTMGSNGLESFTTVVLNSLHYESHLMSTNCGPLGLKADVEPSSNRAALSDRSWAHITHAASDDGDDTERRSLWRISFAGWWGSARLRPS